MSLKVKESHEFNIRFVAVIQIYARGHSGDISSEHDIWDLGWYLGLETRVLRLKMTLELLFGISARECFRDE